MERIEPDRLYSFGDAAALVPSSRRGKNVSPRTLHQWRKAGKFQAHERNGCWFVWGRELLKLLPGALGAPPPVVTAARRRRQHAESVAYLESLGMKVGG